MNIPRYDHLQAQLILWEIEMESVQALLQIKDGDEYLRSRMGVLAMCISMLRRKLYELATPAKP